MQNNLRGIGNQGIGGTPQSEAAHAAPLRGLRMFGHGRNAVAHPLATPLLTSDQALQQLVGNSASAGDLADIEALLQKLENQGSNKADDSKIGQASLGPAQLASGKPRMRRTTAPDDAPSLGPTAT